MNLKSAARRLGVHYQTAYRWVRSGQLLAVKVGSGYEVSEAALEQFEAQRLATQRLPERAEGSYAGAPLTPAFSTQTAVLDVLEAMTAAVTLDPSAVINRCVRLAADVLGDGAIIYRRDADGSFSVAQVAHRDPVSEVNAATIARDSRSATDFIHRSLLTGQPIFIPQVPQRELRKRVPREQHMHIMRSGCFSVICVPVGDSAALCLTRDVPGRPYTREDLAFAEAMAARVAAACERADDWESAHLMRQTVLDSLAAAAETCDAASDLARPQLEELLEASIGDDSQAVVAVLGLDLTHLACTKEYAALLGEDTAQVVTDPLTAYVDDLALLDAILSGELDFRSEDLPRTNGRRPVTMHVAMLRRRDATPWALVVVAHPVRDLASV